MTKTRLRYRSSLGDMALQLSDQQLESVHFGRAPSDLPPLHECDPALAKWFDRYFAGEAVRPGDLSLRLVGTAFQQSVWRELLTVPWGEVVTYGELAHRVGCGSARAVGQAVGRNPLGIVVPCHRVIGAKRALGGFSGGLRVKIALLEREGWRIDTMAGRLLGRRVEEPSTSVKGM